MNSARIVERPIQTIEGGTASARRDALAVEEPLEIRLGQAGEEKSVSITMRTPGHDEELAVGFLFTEGILREPDQIESIQTRQENTVSVSLRPDAVIDWARLERHFYTTSSCGVCGKTSLAALQIQSCPAPLKGRPVFDAEMIHGLPDKIREAQAVFDRTGGLHAAALFDTAGTLLGLREDVGRHNAVDKLIGAQFLSGQTPLLDKLIFVSGRASFELMQKTLMAGLPLLAAVGAPSSLAVQLADEFDLTLLGFVRGERFNIYSSPWRIQDAGPLAPNSGGTGF